MRVLLFGASGQVGSECVVALEKWGVTALTREQADFTEPDTIAAAVVNYQPQVVVNACAYTAVDNAEGEAGIADLVNHLSVGVLAKACADIGAILIHISTDYVFDGSASTPYLESDSVSPLGVYGKTKHLGELAIAQHLTQHIILRTSWVFGRTGNNFVKTMIRLAESRDSLSVVNDQKGRPTYASHLAAVIVELVEMYCRDGALPWGVYHCSNNGELNWHQFAREIFSMAVQRGVILSEPALSAIPSSAYPAPAPRPAYSVLNTNKLETLLGHALPNWESGLNEFFEYR